MNASKHYDDFVDLLRETRDSVDDLCKVTTQLQVITARLDERLIASENLAVEAKKQAAITLAGHEDHKVVCATHFKEIDDFMSRTSVIMRYADKLFWAMLGTFLVSLSGIALTLLTRSF